MMYVPKGLGGITNVNITFFGPNAAVDLTFEHGLRIRLDGQLKSREEARIFIGHSIF